MAGNSEPLPQKKGIFYECLVFLRLLASEDQLSGVGLSKINGDFTFYTIDFWSLTIL